MDFLEIVINGFFDENNNQNLSSYFYRECKKAEKEHYEPIDFFKGCLNVVNKWKNEIHKLTNNRRNELTQALRAAEEGNMQYEILEGETIEQKRRETIEYIKSQLNDERPHAIGDCSFNANLTSLTSGRVLYSIKYAEILQINLSIVEAFQKTIDFSQTDPEYFKTKRVELDTICNIEVAIKSDILTFEFFKHYFAYSYFLFLANDFLNTFFDWNKNAISQEIEKMNEFIERSKKADMLKAMQPTFILDNDEYNYIKLTNGFFDKYNIPNWMFDCKLVYAKYVLFYEFLKEKQKAIQKEQNISDTILSPIKQHEHKNQDLCLAGLDGDNVEIYYKKKYNKWLFDYSDEVFIDGELIDKSQKLGITLSSFNIKPEPKKIEVSGYLDGSKLTEERFLNFEIIRVMKLHTLSMGKSFNKEDYLQYLKSKAKDSAGTPQPIKSKADILKEQLSQYGFFELEKVKTLSEQSKVLIIEKIAESGLPYAIAMLDYLQFILYLEKKHFDSKYKLNREVSKWFDSDKDGRAVKGNISSLLKKTTENKTRYTAYQHKENVIKDYEQLK